MVILLNQGQNPFYKMVALRNTSSNSATDSTYNYDFGLINCDDVNSYLAINNSYCMFSPVDIDGDGFNEILYIYHDQYPHYLLHDLIFLVAKIVILLKRKPTDWYF